MHEVVGVDTSQPVPDYHPLSWKELTSLVTLAFNDATKANDVQCRLVQAIPGHVCPHLTDGPIAKKKAELDSAFVSGFKSGDRELAKKIGVILGITP